MKAPCKKGSAWDSWQLAGEKMRGRSKEDIKKAAIDFAYNDAFAWPPAGQEARYRAFMEGAGE